MNPITRFLKAFFNFFVGDWIILIGVAITFAIVALLENISSLNSLQVAGGYILFIGVAITLAVTLRRETGH